MELRFIKYSVEELADNERFRAWVLKEENNQEWEMFIEDNPEFRIKANKARELVLLLHDTTDVLDEGDVSEMWQNIEHFNQQNQQKSRSLKLRKSVYRAASFLLILSLGTLSYIIFGGKDRGYQFVSSDIMDQKNDARLVLPDGEEIILKTNHSKIAFNNKLKLKINNDTVIDLSLKGRESGKKVRMTEVVIPYGKKSEIFLSDSTKVYLNAGTRLAFPTRFDGETREVFLEGEAYFEVTKNKKKPFIVNMGQIGVKVLGTRFNVSAYPNDENIKTILLEGSVAVKKQTTFGINKDGAILKPYQKASFNKRIKDLTVSDEPNADLYITWTEGWFQFSKENLDYVFTKLERYYNVKIIAPETFHSSQLISGKLDLKESLEDVMKAVADVSGIRFRMDGNKVYIEQN